MTRRFLAGLAVLLVSVFAAIGQAVQPPPSKALDQLVAQLTSDDQQVAQVAREKLQNMGNEAVEPLFHKLQVAEWILKPRLLEVLSSHGREFAREKLSSPSTEARVYAALVYYFALLSDGELPGSDFPELTEPLFLATKSSDKNLSALGAYALLYSRDPSVVLRKYHELMPLLIANFDTPIIVAPNGAAGPWQVLFVSIADALDGLVGDDFVYESNKKKIDQINKRSVLAGVQSQRDMDIILSANAATINELRSTWTTWWNNHKTLSLTQIGRIIIERDARILKNADAKLRRKALWSLGIWASQDFASAEEFEKWWNANKDSYSLE